MPQNGEKYFREIERNSFHSLNSNKHTPFCGEFFDEFGLPLLFTKSACPNVLLLGAGSGSAIPSLEYFSQDLKIDLVDIDKLSLNEIPKKINQNIFCEDAMLFLSKNESLLYDLIWIDLFTDNGYSPLILSSNFWKQLSLYSNNGSIIAINIYGIPSFIRDEDNHPLNTILNLTKDFEFKLKTKHRRNTTLLLSKSPLIIQKKDSSPNNSNSLDLLNAYFMTNQTWIEPLSKFKKDEIPLSFIEIKKAESESYKNWLENISLNFSEETSSKISLFIANPTHDTLVENFFCAKLKEDSEDALFYPISLAWKSRQSGPESVIDLILKCTETLIQQNPPRKLFIECMNHLTSSSTPSTKNEKDFRFLIKEKLKNIT